MKRMLTRDMVAMVDLANVFLGWETSLSTFRYNNVRQCLMVNTGMPYLTRLT